MSTLARRLACDVVPMVSAKERKPVLVRAVRGNIGIEMAYRKALLDLIDEMNKSVNYWLLSSYRKNKPELAQDESPTAALTREFSKLARRWEDKFDDVAKERSKTFASKAKNHAEKSFKRQLDKAGFTVQFKMTPEVNDAYRAVIAENVGLIRSIASQHLSAVEGIVMRSVQSGRDLGYVAKELQKRYGLTKDRAALIARDQNNKATSVINRARQTSLGIKKAIWRHSTAGKVPRPDHVKANGKTYDVRKGMFLEGKWTWPGVEINCRCTSVSIIPGLG